MSTKLSNIFDKYYIVARLFPAMISAIPYVLVYGYFIRDLIRPVLPVLQSFYSSVVFDISVIFVLIYLLSEANRFISKSIWQTLYFSGELYMPTTNFLMYSNNYFSDQYKERLRSNIEEDFAIEMPSRENEIQNELQARKRIAEAVRYVRSSVGSGKLVLQHNIEYGFWRNLIGGSTLTVLVCFLGYILSATQHTPYGLPMLFIVAALLYAIPILASKYIMVHYGQTYGKVLFQEYDSGSN